MVYQRACFLSDGVSHCVKREAVYKREIEDGFQPLTSNAWIFGCKSSVNDQYLQVHRETEPANAYIKRIFYLRQAFSFYDFSVIIFVIFIYEYW